MIEKETAITRETGREIETEIGEIATETKTGRGRRTEIEIEKGNTDQEEAQRGAVGSITGIENDHV